MKLWLLQARDGAALWDPWYDKAFGHVVRAEDEATARRIASEDCGDEGKAAWLDERHSTCVELTANGDAGHILRDLWSA